MKKGILIPILTLLWLIAAAQPTLRPSIGLGAEPAGNYPICPIPYFTSGNFDGSGLMPGDTAFDFKFYDLNGDSLVLSEALGQGKPVILVAGSYTCPVFRGKIPIINDLADNYSNFVSIYVIYELEAHPYIDTTVYFGYVNPGSENINAGILYRQPTTYGSRKVMVQEMLDSLSIHAPIFLDGPCNEFWATYGPAPNNAYLIDTNGRVFTKHGWFHRQPDHQIYCEIDSLLSILTGNCTTTTTNGQLQWQLVGSPLAMGPAGNTIYAHGRLINTSPNGGVNVLMKKLQTNLPTGWQTSMCVTGTCFSPNTDSVTVYIPADDTLDYTMYFYTAGPLPDSGRVRMGFRNTANANNSFSQWFTGITDSVMVGMEELGRPARKVMLFPNPVENNATVWVGWGDNFPLVRNAWWEITDVMGHVLRSETWNGEEKIELDLSSFTGGVYFFRLIGKGGEEMGWKRWVKL